MRSSHVLSRVTHSFDEPNLVSHGGLSAPAMLCQRIGLDALVAATVTVPGRCGANSAAKVATVLGGMLTGADSIDDLDVLRAGATGTLLDDHHPILTDRIEPLLTAEAEHRGHAIIEPPPPAAP